MLIDCGYGYDLRRQPNYKAPRRPDKSRTPGEWVARYLEKFHPDGENGVLDYLVIAHFHSDHIGGVPELAKHYCVHELRQNFPRKRHGDSLRYNESGSLGGERACRIAVSQL